MTDKMIRTGLMLNAFFLTLRRLKLIRYRLDPDYVGRLPAARLCSRKPSSLKMLIEICFLLKLMGPDTSRRAIVLVIEREREEEKREEACKKMKLISEICSRGS